MEKIQVVKVTVVESAVKVVKEEKSEIIKDGKFIVGMFTSNGFMTAAQYAKAENNSDFAKKYGKDWAKEEYAVHYAQEIADLLCDGKVTERVSNNWAKMEAAYNVAEDKRKADAEYRKTHKDEVALKRLEKAASSAARTAKSESVKAFSRTVASKCNKYLDMMGDEFAELDAALESIAAAKAAVKAA